MIINPKSLINDIENLYETGVARGHTTGWSNVDEYFTVKHGEFTVITGMPSHGKSEWLDALCVNLAVHHNYRIAMFSPENHPLEMHAKKIIEKYAGKPFFGSHRMSHDEMLASIDRMNKNFAFIKPEETAFTPINIIDEALPWLDMSITQPRAMVIDPWNEMDHYRPSAVCLQNYVELHVSLDVIYS
jgi:twinkle protein